MPKKYPHKMPIEHHKALGRKLKKANEILTIVSRKLSKTYGTGDKNSLQAGRIDLKVLDLRDALTKQFDKEYPEEPYQSIYL